MKRKRHNGGPIINTNPNPDGGGGAANINRTSGGSNLSIASSDNPTTGVTSVPTGGATPNRNPNGSILNGSRASSIVTLQVGRRIVSHKSCGTIYTILLQASPGSARRDNAPELKTPEKRRHRESYFEAVSMGSLQGDEAARSGPARGGGPRNRGDRASVSSVTSEPIDL